MNRRVDADYVSTSVSEYVEAYNRFLAAILVSPKEAARASSEVFIGLAETLEKISSKPCPDTRFKLLSSDEPVISLSPSVLHYDGTKLRTDTMSSFYFGLEMNFPRVISLGRDNHEILYDTAEFPTRRIFEDMKLRIQSVTDPCKIRSPSRIHRPPIRITDEMRELMREHPCLKQDNLELL